jgi:hypothetical protein
MQGEQSWKEKMHIQELAERKKNREYAERKALMRTNENK